ncbi:MAG: hypothetical protein IJW63_05735 [Lachnospiraceae bacterium]|nr:hypothetical protein [Lachnospiraceae bacterium]
MRQRMKSFGVVWQITLKRLFARRSFWVVLLLLPLLIVAIQGLEKEQEQGLRAAVYSKETIWQEHLTGAGIPSFYFVDSLENLKDEVLHGNAECGYYIQEGLLQAFAEDDWYWQVEVYESSNSMFTKLINEALFSRLFQVVSSEWYLDYMGKKLVEAGASTSEMEVLDALSQNMLSGETFQVETVLLTKTNEIQQEKEPENLLSTRSVVAAMIYLVSLLAVMDVVRDREKMHFPVKQRVWAAFCTIFHPTLMVAMVGGIGILVTETERRNWNELFGLLGLIILTTLYGILLSLVVRRERWMYGVIPVLFVGALVCCPVFVDLGSIIPIFQWIEKLFPVAFYL